MVIPLGDSPNPRGFPFINYALIIANIAVFVLISLPLSTTPVDRSNPALAEYVTVVSRTARSRLPREALLERTSAYDLFIFEHGFRPSAPDAVALFESLFLHASLLHLLGNMLIVWIYGNNVEHRLGHLRYLFAYIATGVAATLFHMSFAADSPTPMVGASGAISGVLGFYFRWFPRNKVRLFVFLFPFLMDVIEVPARLVLGFYLLADNLLPFLLSASADGGVAYGAHIGGFIAGVIAAWILNRRHPQVIIDRL